MPNEIERKFIVSHIPNDLANKKITQGYLQSEKHRTVRIRIVNDSSNNETAYLTIKGKSNRAGTSRYEFEIQIPINEATHLIEMCDKPLIEKTRHIYNTDNVKWEIDEFHGANNGLLLAEIELLNEDQKFVLPDFVVKEVTGLKKYYNSMLQRNPYTTWENNSSKQ